MTAASAVSGPSGVQDFGSNDLARSLVATPSEDSWLARTDPTRLPPIGPIRPPPKPITPPQDEVDNLPGRILLASRSKTDPTIIDEPKGPTKPGTDGITPGQDEVDNGGPRPIYA